LSTTRREVVERAWAAWADRDFDRATALWHPEVEWDLTRFDEAPPGFVARGIPAVMEMIAMWMTQWRAYDVAPEMIVEAAGDDVFLTVRRTARDKSTGHEADRVAAQVWTIRDGLIYRIRSFSDVHEARREAGLG
jgi:ketosteroid isomerase-like protein